MRPFLVIAVLVFFHSVSWGERNFQDERKDMGPSYVYQGEVFKDIEIPGSINRVISLCYPREVTINLKLKTPEEKWRITQSFLNHRSEIVRFIKDSLNQRVEASDQIFHDHFPEIAPDVAKLYQLGKESKAFDGRKIQQLTQEEKRQYFPLREEIRSLQKKLFGSYSFSAKKMRGGTIPALDQERKIMDFKEIRFFAGHAKDISREDFDKVRNKWKDNVGFFFRIQGAILLGEFDEPLFSTGQFNKPKSEFIAAIEQKVAELVNVDHSDVVIKGNKSWTEQSDFCQKKSLSPIFDI